MTALSYQEIEETETHQFGEEKAEGECGEALGSTGECKTAVHHRTRTNGAIGETYSRSH